MEQVGIISEIIGWYRHDDGMSATACKPREGGSFIGSPPAEEAYLPSAGLGLPPRMMAEDIAEGEESNRIAGETQNTYSRSQDCPCKDL